MIDEVRLQEAAKEAARVMLKALPENDDIQYTPSSGFTRKMMKIIRREKHPVRYYSMRSVAIVLAVALLGGIFLCGFSLDARAAVLGWLKELLHETYFEYDFEGENTVDVTGVRYETSWVPDGFMLIQHEVIDGLEMFLYVDEKGFNAEFSYMFATIEGDQKVLMDGNQPYYDYSVVEIMGYKADCYMSNNDEHSSGLIWSDENDTFFSVSAVLPKDELIKWAESIVEIKD